MLYKEMLKRAKESKEIKCLTPTYLTWEKEGQQVVGKFISTVEVDSSLSEGKYSQYLVETDEGLVKFALGTATDRELIPLLKPGYVYLFTFKGREELSGGKRVNKFSIDEIITGEVIDIPKKPVKTGKFPEIDEAIEESK